MDIETFTTYCIVAAVIAAILIRIGAAALSYL